MGPPSQTILVLLSSLCGLGLAGVTTDVRCYCNLPACLGTGHMCRSSVRVCVSEGTHACFELLATHTTPAEYCGNATRHCCNEDMCNYPKNTTHVTGYLSNHDPSLLSGSKSWFHLTVTVVPVAGGAVLVVLVIMATKMLKSGGAGRTATSHQLEGQKPIKPLAKSLSCVVLDRGQARSSVVRSCTSMVSLGHSPLSVGQSMFSIETDSSREQYFVFDL